MSTMGLLLFFTVMGVATFITRVLPFLFLKAHRHSELLLHFGRVMPVMILVVLVGFGVIGLLETRQEDATLMLIAMVITTLVHLIFRQAVVSIVIGTAIYVLGVQGVLW